MGIHVRLYGREVTLGLANIRRSCCCVAGDDEASRTKKFRRGQGQTARRTRNPVPGPARRGEVPESVDAADVTDGARVAAVVLAGSSVFSSLSGLRHDLISGVLSVVAGL
jgi:hypothetical protein